jgi:hypothetical protein
MSNPRLFVVVLMVIPFLCCAVDRSAAAEVRNDTAPSFTLKLLNGGEFKTSDIKGKIAVLKFVASY